MWERTRISSATPHDWQRDRGVTWLIDTNVLSEIRKRRRADRAVVEWYGKRTPEELYVSVLTLGELWRGARRLRARDSGAANALDIWLEGLVRGFRDRILIVDIRVASCWSALGVPDPIPDIDGLIGATALVHDLVVVTRNVKHIAPTGARILNPFTPPAVDDRGGE